MLIISLEFHHEGALAMSPKEVLERYILAGFLQEPNEAGSLDEFPYVYRSKSNPKVRVKVLDGRQA